MPSTPRRRRYALPVRGLIAAPLLLAPGLALADCVADSTGTNVTCSGTSAAYTNLASGISVTVPTGATVTPPLQIGANGTLANAGTFTGTTTSPAVQFGTGANITNTGTMTTTGTGASAALMALGDGSQVTNSGTITASGYAAYFGANGSFTNTASAPAALTGTIAFNALSAPGSVSSFTNANLTYGFTGGVASNGLVNITNTGLWNGNIAETAAGGTGSFLNDTGATYSGVASLGDGYNVVNNGTMTLLGGSGIGSPLAANSTFLNNGSLFVGTGTAPAQLKVLGSFTQTANGTLNLSIAPPGSVGITAGTNFGQVYASGANGTASLAGNLALTINPGFYATGSIYQVVLADKGITGSLAVSGNTLPFLTFAPLGVVTTTGTQQAYELQVQRTTTYAGALAAGTLAGTIAATPNQLAIAGALQPLATSADAAPTGNAAALVGAIDVLTLAQAQTFLDGVSPAGYLSYATALRDQANVLTRQVALRIADHNSDRVQDGFWGSVVGQFQFGATPGGDAKSRLFGFNVGYDISSPKYVIGGVFHASWDSQTYQPGTMTGTNRAVALGAYGAYRLGPVRATLQADYTFGHLGATKTAMLNTTPVVANASASEHLLKATGTLGFEMKADSLSLEPFVGIDYANGKVNGFTETGPNAAALTVAAIDATRTDLVAGYSLTSNKGLWRPYVRTQYRSQMGSGAANTVSAYFNGDPTTSFTVAGVGPSRHQIDTDMGINYVVDDQGGFFVGYQGTTRGSVQSHGITVGMRIEFE